MEYFNTKFPPSANCQHCDTGKGEKKADIRVYYADEATRKTLACVYIYQKSHAFIKGDYKRLFDNRAVNLSEPVTCLFV